MNPLVETYRLRSPTKTEVCRLISIAEMERGGVRPSQIIMNDKDYDAVAHHMLCGVGLASDPFHRVSEITAVWKANA